MKKLLIAALLASGLSSPAAASGTGWGTPSALIVRNNGVVLFNTSAPKTGNIPGCATAAQRFAFDANTMGGQAMLSSLMTAIARGKRVSVLGGDNCGVWGDTESVIHILFED